ncbi:MAG: pirin family protein [Firmicutes bacterium]|nr:pirin family protein [Alicyclobacillaceae bacterium]MCL6497403.1 pirin family protein [Bacillota bacterium]
MGLRAVMDRWRPVKERRSAIHAAAMVLPPGRYEDFDPFLMMAEDWFRQGTFAEHPHRGIETVTYVIAGHLAHYDSTSGHAGTLGPGDVQWMTAGRGVIHLEDPVPGEEVHSLQLWVNLPRAEKLCAPRYQDLRVEAMPTVTQDGITARLYSGELFGVVAPTANVVPVTMAEIGVPEGGAGHVPIASRHRGFVYVLEGAGRFGENGVAASAGEVLWLSDEGVALPVQAGAPLRFLLFTGVPLGEPVVAYGPFVMNSMDEIREAFRDYQLGRFATPSS